ncbi:MAG: metallophosphoesterase [Myxococcales bacterium]|nr:metallophosphoesterase [Myxococcales bacterium]
MDNFDELHTVSDLHLGGREGAEVFCSERELAALIQWAANRARGGRRVAFGILGDIVDFLSFDGSGYFNPQRAVEWLDEVATKRPTKVVFEALREFTAVADATLVLVLGNHDIELALPDVRQRLIDHCAGANEQRVRVVFDGTGYECRVGGERGATVLCLHGNERDKWNCIDHGALQRSVRSVRIGGLPAQEVAPNAGTRLVIDALNKAKRQIPFIDLLQPEQEVALRVVLALSEQERGVGLASALGPAAKIWSQLREDESRLARGTLGLEPTDDPLAALEVESDATSDLGSADARAAYVSDLFDKTEMRFENSADPLDPKTIGSNGSLGLLDDAVRWFTRGSLPETLRRAIGVDDDGSDKPANNVLVGSADASVEAIRSWVRKDRDVVIAGHTHVAKFIETKRAGSVSSVFMNSGTWIRVIRLRPAWLDEPTFSSELMPGLLRRTMRELDAATVAGSPLVSHDRTVASVEPTENGAVVARLRFVATLAAADGANAAPPAALDTRQLFRPTLERSCEVVSAPTGGR